MQKKTEIDELKERLHDIASSQPECDPFSYAGSQEWQEWTEGCREAEQALTDAGVVI